MSSLPSALRSTSSGEEDIEGMAVLSAGVISPGEKLRCPSFTNQISLFSAGFVSIMSTSPSASMSPTAGAPARPAISNNVELIRFVGSPWFACN